jgi:hypothetical protein
MVFKLAGSSKYALFGELPRQARQLLDLQSLQCATEEICITISKFARAFPEMGIIATR